MTASIRLFFEKYLLPRPFEFQYIEVAQRPILLKTLDLTIKCIISQITLINYGVLCYTKS